jgi:type II secretory pathway pseudopilin PulG
MIELLIVLTIITIITGVTFYFLTATKNLYKPDEQALNIADVLQEARQRSLTQRETIRVEIDLTDNMVRLIDENEPETADDDKLIRVVQLMTRFEVRIDQRPGQIPENPPEDFPVPSAVFKQSIYPPSHNHNVCTMRFVSNGTVVDAGNNDVGRDAVATGATLHVWSPDPDNISNSKIARAITVIGSTGSIRLWEYDNNLPTPNKWKDTRRTSVFGEHGLSE